MRIHRRKGSPHFWYDFSVRGRRFRGSTGTDDRDIADQIASKLRTDELLSVTTGKKPSLTLDAAFGRWWMETGQHHRSWRRAKGVIKTLLRMIGKDVLLEHLDDDLVGRVVAKRRGQVSDSTVTRELAVLRGTLTTARRKWKVATGDIDWSMHKLADPDPIERYLTPEEADRLIAAAAPHLRPILTCLLYTCMRRTNALSLDWSRIDMAARLITIFVKSKKPGGKKVVIPIATPLLTMLANLGPRDRGPVFTYQRPTRIGHNSPKAVADVKTGFRNACARAGLIRWEPYEGKYAAKVLKMGDGPCTPVRWVPTLRLHDLRHTGASWMIQAGVPLDVVQKLLGHSDIKLTQRYAHRRPEAQREAVEAIGRHWRSNGTESAQKLAKKRVTR